MLFLSNQMHCSKFFLFLLLFPFALKAQVRPALQYQREAVRLFNVSEYDSAAYCYEKAISVCRSCPDTLNARLQLGLSKMYKYAERMEETYLHLVDAEKYALKSRSDAHLSLTYVYFAEYFRSTRKFDQADQYIGKAFGIISKGKVPDEVLAEYYNRKAAILSEGHSDYPATIAYSHKNIALARKMDNKDLEAVSWNEIGFAYEKMAPPDFWQSISCYRKAVEIWEKTGEDQSLANALGNLVRVYLKTNQYDLALQYNQQGYELARQKKFAYWFTVFTYHQYQIYRHQNKLVPALETLEKYQQLNADYTKKHWVKAMAKAENEHETRQKDQELKLNQLKLRNRELALKKNKQNRMYLLLGILFVSAWLLLILMYSVKTRKTNRRLQSLLNENQFLLGESNHRIKNNLQLITALVYQEMEKQKVDLEESSLFEIVEKIEAVSSLHKQLYTNDSKQLIRIDTYLEEIRGNFKNFFQKRGIDVTFDIESMEISINKSLYLGILCTELMLNSLKHAFNEGNAEKKISLSLKKENGRILFQYSDSGPGLKSVDTRLKLVHMMSQQLKFGYEIRNAGYFFFTADLTGTL